MSESQQLSDALSKIPELVTKAVTRLSPIDKAFLAFLSLVRSLPRKEGYEEAMRKFEAIIENAEEIAKNRVDDNGYYDSLRGHWAEYEAVIGILMKTLESYVQD